MVSVLAGLEYGIGPVALSLPCIVGRGGIARQLMLSMSEEEQRMLQHSAAVLDKAYQSLGAGGNDSLPSCGWPANPGRSLAHRVSPQLTGPGIPLRTARFQDM
jgi:hypothetical protein